MEPKTRSALLTTYEAQTAILDWLASLGHPVDYTDEPRSQGQFESGLHSYCPVTVTAGPVR